MPAGCACARINTVKLRSILTVTVGRTVSETTRQRRCRFDKNALFSLKNGDEAKSGSDRTWKQLELIRG